MSILYASAEDVENTFYEAIARADLNALMSVWADDEEIVCIHPTGQRLCGHASIRESWSAIFASNPRLTMRITHSVRWSGLLLAVHNVVEALYLGNEPTPHGPLLSTNVFQRGANGWRLLSHHSSTATGGVGEAADGGPPNGGTQRTLH